MSDDPERPEYVNLTEHIRQRESAMVNLLTVTVVAATSLFAAVVTLVFEREDPTAWSPTAYTLLTPILILLPGVVLITGARRDIRRMGTYLKVFHEKKGTGLAWHLRLEAFRGESAGESLDAVPLAMWSIALLACFAYWAAAAMAEIPVGLTPPSLHLLAPIPFIVGLAVVHWQFSTAQDPRPFEEVWKTIRSREANASTEELTPAVDPG